MALHLLTLLKGHSISTLPLLVRMIHSQSERAYKLRGLICDTMVSMGSYGIETIVASASEGRDSDLESFILTRLANIPVIQRCVVYPLLIRELRDGTFSRKSELLQVIQGLNDERAYLAMLEDLRVCFILGAADRMTIALLIRRIGGPGGLGEEVLLEILNSKESIKVRSAAARALGWVPPLTPMQRRINELQKERDLIQEKRKVKNKQIENSSQKSKDLKKKDKLNNQEGNNDSDIDDDKDEEGFKKKYKNESISNFNDFDEQKEKEKDKEWQMQRKREIEYEKERKNGIRTRFYVNVTEVQQYNEPPRMQILHRQVRTQYNTTEPQSLYTILDKTNNEIRNEESVLIDPREFIALLRQALSENLFDPHPQPEDWDEDLDDPQATVGAEAGELLEIEQKERFLFDREINRLINREDQDRGPRSWKLKNDGNSETDSKISDLRSQTPQERQFRKRESQDSTFSKVRRSNSPQIGSDDILSNQQQLYLQGSASISTYQQSQYSSSQFKDKEQQQKQHIMDTVAENEEQEEDNMIYGGVMGNMDENDNNNDLDNDFDLNNEYNETNEEFTPNKRRMGPFLHGYNSNTLDRNEAYKQEMKIEDVINEIPPPATTRVVSSLIRAFLTAPLNVRVAAGSAICDLGCRSASVAVAPLLESLEDSEPKVREISARALGSFGSIDYVLDTLDHEERNKTVAMMRSVVAMMEGIDTTNQPINNQQQQSQQQQQQLSGGNTSNIGFSLTPGKKQVNRLPHKPTGFLSSVPRFEGYGSMTPTRSLSRNRSGGLISGSTSAVGNVIGSYAPSPHQIQTILALTNAAAKGQLPPLQLIVNSLIKSLRDPFWKVRYCVVESLGRLAKTCDYDPAAFPRFGLFIKDNSYVYSQNQQGPTSQSGVIETPLSIYSPQFPRPLLPPRSANLKTASFFTTSPAYISTVAVVAAPLKSAIYPLAQCLRDGTVNRKHVAATMACMSPQGLDALLQATAAFAILPTQVRAAIVFGLRCVDLGATVAAASDAVVETLHLACRDPIPIVRRAGIRAMGSLFRRFGGASGTNNSTAGNGIQSSLLNTQSQGAIVYLRPKSFLPLIYPFLRDKDRGVREAASATLAKSGPEGILLLKEGLLRDTSSAIRSACAIGLFFAGTDSIRTVLLALGDRDEQVRQAAEKVIVAFGSKAIAREITRGIDGLKIPIDQLEFSPQYIALNEAIARPNKHTKEGLAIIKAVLDKLDQQAQSENPNYNYNDEDGENNNEQQNMDNLTEITTAAGVSVGESSLGRSSLNRNLKGSSVGNMNSTGLSNIQRKEWVRKSVQQEKEKEMIENGQKQQKQEKQEQYDQDQEQEQEQDVDMSSEYLPMKKRDSYTNSNNNNSSSYEKEYEQEQKQQQKNKGKNQSQKSSKKTEQDKYEYKDKYKYKEKDSNNNNSSSKYNSTSGSDTELHTRWDTWRK
ncbi:MAG: hypothetical protein EZS28_003135 [Streblomastix strix]|uniref:Uncharacterized protein n=1 Tax=Streblomastix strix TaxID=222440 RepID=A0A5J4X3W5_9EUKA|nr:MAG: hypothetical protein EZS28_003135 [Streblomastix strix]